MTRKCDSWLTPAVRRRVKAICDRLGFASSIQAVVWAVRQGLM
jgi:hypothetical protein